MASEGWRRNDTARRGAGAAPATIQRLRALPAPPARMAALSDGQVLVLEHPPPPFARLLRRARVLVEEIFALEGPPQLAHCLPPDVFAQRTLALQGRFAQDRDVREAFWQTASTLQMGDAVYRDQLFLRVLPPDGTVHSRFAPLHPHRDSWGSRILGQENWWAPVLPVSRLNTLGLYLDHWQRAVENESATWSFEAYRAHREAAGSGGRLTYPSAPRATWPPPAAAATPLQMAVGSLAMFSGAQLHVSLPNRSGLTRFSVETRTVSLQGPDRALPSGPANVDTALRRPYLGWFRDREGVSLAASFGVQVLA